MPPLGPKRQRLESFLPNDIFNYLVENHWVTDPNKGWISVSRTSFSFFNGDVRTWGGDYVRTIEMPEYVQSVQTFLFFEFDYDTARRLYRGLTSYNNDPSNEPVTPVEYAKWHVGDVKGDARGRHDPWKQVLEDIGMSQKWKDSLWASNFPHGNRWVQRDSTVKEEILGLLDDRWKELGSIGERIKQKYLDQQRGTD